MLCPKCGSEKTHKNGSAKSGETIIKLFYCRECRSTFQERYIREDKDKK